MAGVGFLPSRRASTWLGLGPLGHPIPNTRKTYNPCAHGNFIHATPYTAYQTPASAVSYENMKLTKKTHAAQRGSTCKTYLQKITCYARRVQRLIHPCKRLGDKQNPQAVELVVPQADWRQVRPDPGEGWTQLGIFSSLRPDSAKASDAVSKEKRTRSKREVGGQRYGILV